MELQQRVLACAPASLVLFSVVDTVSSRASTVFSPINCSKHASSSLTEAPSQSPRPRTRISSGEFAVLDTTLVS